MGTSNAKNDTAALERLLVSEFVTTDSDGRLMTRADFFARRKSGAVNFTTLAQDDYNVPVIGDTAIVTSRSTIKGIRNAKDWSGPFDPEAYC